MAKVVKLAQPGFDVKTAGDENLIYNSNWPLLRIYKQGSFTSPSNTANTTITTHDLGFIPMYWVFSNLPITAWNGPATGREARSEFGGLLAPISVRIFNDRLVQNHIGLAAFDSFQGLEYFIFALDLTKQFTAPIIKAGNLTGGSAKRTVFKLAKPGKDISSANLEDYIVHSRARSPLVHSVNPGKTTDLQSSGLYAFNVYHNLGYIPLFFGYLKNSDGSYNQIETGDGGSTIFTSDEQKVSYQSSAGSEITIVVLKDPFVVDNTISVTV